ncbi:unnamed protein product [Rotaria magnacalcarata]|uniref:Uncharacterized protein n=1 Tax=Rotaria magnacalcarata TaxID=392030 RepID=A0A816Z6A2_9BILA|nr:unnamed protein product [Rotaria magnacalcarata]
MFNRLSGINGGRKPNRKKYSSKYCFRLVSDKKYRWLHNLLKMRGIELEPEMIICSQCQIALYRENKRRRSLDMESICNGDDLKNYEDHEYERQQEILPLDNLLILDNIYGNGDDYIYCTWCKKAGVKMKQLSLSERMTLLCEHNLYTSHTARRCTAGLPTVKVPNGVQNVSNGVHMGYNSFPNRVRSWGTKCFLQDKKLTSRNGW